MASELIDLAPHMGDNVPVEDRFDSFNLDPDYGSIHIVGHVNHATATAVVARWTKLGEQVVLPDEGPTAFHRTWFVLDRHESDCDMDLGDPDDAAFLAEGGPCLGCGSCNNLIHVMNTGIEGYVRFVDKATPGAIPVTVVTICDPEVRPFLTVLDATVEPDGVVVLTEVPVPARTRHNLI